MLQASARLLLLRSSSCLPAGAAAAAAAAGALGGGSGALQQALLQPHLHHHQQVRGKASSSSSGGGGSPAAADDAASFQLYDAAASSGRDAAAGSLDGLPAADLLAQADAIAGVSEAATAATIAAAQGGVWTGTRWFIDLLLWTHDGMGLPWFEAIAVTNLLVRLLTIPVTYLSQKLGPQMQALRQDTQQVADLTKRMNKASTASEYSMLAGEQARAMEAFNARWSKRSRYAAFVMPLLGVAQAAVFISQFSAVSTLTGAKLPSMTYEGALWFPDLTSPDPVYGLPVLCAVTTWAMLRSPRFADSMGTSGEQAQLMRKIMMFVALSFIPTGGFVSAAVALLWSSNSVFMMAQNALLGSPRVRAAIGLPQPPAAASSGGGGGGSSSGDQGWLAASWQRLLGGGSPKPAAAAGAPTPGSKKAQAQKQAKPGVAVSYVATRPPRRKPRAA